MKMIDSHWQTRQKIWCKLRHLLWRELVTLQRCGMVVQCLCDYFQPGCLLLATVESGLYGEHRTTFMQYLINS